MFQGVATRYEMFQIFNRHSEAPFDEARHSGSIYAGEWFEITEADHDYMFEILPPLFVRGGLFAMREFQAGNVTSVFLALTIDDVCRWFHGYCDLSDKGSPERLRAAIIERESHPVRAMTREERLSISGAAPMATIAAMPVSGLPLPSADSAPCCSVAAGRP